MFGRDVEGSMGMLLFAAALSVVGCGFVEEKEGLEQIQNFRGNH